MYDGRFARKVIYGIFLIIPVILLIYMSISVKPANSLELSFYNFLATMLWLPIIYFAPRLLIAHFADKNKLIEVLDDILKFIEVGILKLAKGNPNRTKVVYVNNNRYDNNDGGNAYYDNSDYDEDDYNDDDSRYNRQYSRPYSPEDGFRNTLGMINGANKMVNRSNPFVKSPFDNYRSPITKKRRRR